MTFFSFLVHKLFIVPFMSVLRIFRKKKELPPADLQMLEPTSFQIDNGIINVLASLEVSREFLEELEERGYSIYYYNKKHNVRLGRWK